LSTAAACLALLGAALAANQSAAELSYALPAGALLVGAESHAGLLHSQRHCQHPMYLSLPDCSCYHLTAAVGAAVAAAVLGDVPAAETGTVAAALPAAVDAVSATVAAVSAAVAAVCAAVVVAADVAAAVAAAGFVAEIGCQMEAWACQVAWQTGTLAQGTSHKHHTAHRHWNRPLACASLWAAWPQAWELMQGMHCQH